MEISPYIKSMKWRHYYATSQIFLAYLLVKWPPALYDFWMMFLLFLIFGPLLYGGLYTINDIFDVEEDKKHCKKKNRPLASGKIKVHNLAIFSLILIGSALILSYILDFNIFLICLLFIIINFLYSMFFKKIPYLEIIVNAITHPLRFFTGLITAGSIEYINLMVIVFLSAFSYVTLKRKNEIREKQTQARKVLRYYTYNKIDGILTITWIIMLIFIFFQKGIALIISLLFLILNSFIIMGYNYWTPIKKFLNRIY